MSKKPTKYAIAAHIRWQSSAYRQRQASGLKAHYESRKAETESLRVRVAELEAEVARLRGSRAMAEAADSTEVVS